MGVYTKPERASGPKMMTGPCSRVMLPTMISVILSYNILAIPQDILYISCTIDILKLL
jgi:hypothetical protein